MILEEQNSEELNTSEGDSSQEEHLTEETETEETLEEGTEEDKTQHPSPKEKNEKIDWKKRHDDLQRKFTPMTQELADLKAKSTEREKQFAQPSAEEVEKGEVAELEQFMAQYKGKTAQGMTAWIRGREKKVNSQFQASLSPIYAQIQYLGWRQNQVMDGITREDLKEKEKKMQEVIKKNPAILQFPNALEQAEALVIGAKDMNQVKKEILKAEEQRQKQREGHTVGASKSKGKGKKTQAQRASEFYGMKFAEPKER